MSGEKGKEVSAESTILRYLTDQNRPYCVNDVLLNMKKEVGKAALQKALDKLVQIGVGEKGYGKQKLYFANQKDLGELRAEERITMDARIESLEKEIQEQEYAVKTASLELRDVTATLTTVQAEKILTQLQQEVQAMHIRTHALAGQVAWINQEERKLARDRGANAILKSKNRKRVAIDMLGTTLENYGKDRKSLAEEMEIETDEDAGVKIPCLGTPQLVLKV